MIEYLSFIKPEIGGLASIIYWLVTITASVSLGVVLFTLILKIVTLPFDYLSRASMRKNNLIMESMRPELEKLQKQYADNKDLYNQKMMALYKKNGYSAFGACLPTILTLVIFIVAINAFTDYSKFQNRLYFYNMTCAYNEAIYEGLETDDTYIVKNEDGSITVDIDRLKNIDDKVTLDNHEIFVNKQINGSNTVYTVTTTNCYVKYVYDGVFHYEVIEDRLNTSTLKSEKNNFLKVNGKTYSEAKTENPELTAVDFLKDICRMESAESFRNEKMSFLWVKNIWVTDSATKNPIESNYDAFRALYDSSASGSCSCNSDYIGSCDSNCYNELVYNLSAEKSSPNGYFIMIVLTIGVTFLAQVINNKAQKAQMELQTVDGQGVMQSKIMKYMMPVMMAIFAFMYSAAFSLYIVLSSALSILTTLGINALVDKRYKHLKKQEKTVIRGRVHNQEPAPAPVKKKGKQPEKNDFLSGLQDKKHRK